MSEKLQKILARAGVASRRKAEDWVREGRVEVNGQVATIGCRVTKKDKITVDGELLEWVDQVEEPRIIAYHKPVGEICTRSDPDGRPTVYDNLPRLPHGEGRWVSVGRLDFNTSGLLLFTNHGELANNLMHPSSGLAREYAVRIFGDVTDEMVRRLCRGVQLDDGFARFEDIVDSGGKGINHWFHVVLMEGRQRLVRRLWESQGVQVSRLKRVRFGPVFLEARLRQGAWENIDKNIYRELIKYKDLAS